MTQKNFISKYFLYNILLIVCLIICFYTWFSPYWDSFFPIESIIIFTFFFTLFGFISLIGGLITIHIERLKYLNINTAFIILCFTPIGLGLTLYLMFSSKTLGIKPKSKIGYHEHWHNKQKQQKNVAKLTTNIPEEIRKYKQLLDDNIITNKEFEEKKKQLLNKP
tara:strand:+ start:649 stop:1143 length:495 start_codon:yes stop_codon:yes gene_type:complete